MVRRCFRSIIAISAVFLVAHAPQRATAKKAPRPQLEIEVVGSDELVEAIMTVQADGSSLGIGPEDHAKISSILGSTKDLVENARALLENEATQATGQELMDQAYSSLRLVKEHIRNINGILRRESKETRRRELLRKRYSGHNIQRANEDDARSLDISRNMYETLTTFPECVELWYEDCVDLINADLDRIGLSSIEMVVHQKRNHDQDGYNKVVIVTNQRADKVVGRTGDGIVTYPYQWYDAQSGERTLGVDGKWSCLNTTPEDCCATIKASVPNPDIRGNHIQCHIFVPFGGVGNARRNDRVIINVSSDGRVHEPPVIT